MTTESAAPGGAAAPAGVIHDLGYRRYQGPRGGRRAIVTALAWHSLRSAFGIRRGARAKVVPVISLAIMCLPALVSATAVATGAPQLVTYSTYVFTLRVIVMIVFVAAQAPELLSRDLRSHVLPLYFSRPLRRTDYPLAKLIGFTGACLIVLDLPLVVLYFGTIDQSHPAGGIWLQTRALLAGLLLGGAWAALLAAIGLALASFSSRSRSPAR